jgi:integrase
LTFLGKSVKMASRKGKTAQMHLVQAITAGNLPYLTKAEVERFFRVIPRSNSRDRLLFDTIYRHGLRRLEAARIRGITSRKAASGSRE